MKRFLVAAVLTFSFLALAQAQWNGCFPGICAPITAAAPPPTPCTTGQLDFSAGCNAVFFTGAMRP